MKEKQYRIMKEFDFDVTKLLNGSQNMLKKGKITQMGDILEAYNDLMCTPEIWNKDGTVKQEHRIID